MLVAVLTDAVTPVGTVKFRLVYVMAPESGSCDPVVSNGVDWSSSVRLRKAMLPCASDPWRLRVAGAAMTKPWL